MLVKDFITREIPVLKKYDTGEYALTLMDDFKVKHLPFVNDGVYQGLVAEKDLLAYSDLSQELDPVAFASPSASESSHLHEVLALITRDQLSMLPIVDADGNYQGVVTREHLVDVLSDLCCADAEGSVIVLEVMPQDYSLADIARLVEANHARVLNLLYSQEKETGRLLITIKIDLEDASPVIRSFERFNYTVRYHFMEKGMVDDMLSQRMNELLHYMNM